MFRYATRLVILISLFVGSTAVLVVAAPVSETTTSVANAGWEEMGSGSASGGGISGNGGNSYEPSLAIGPGSIPVIAWADDSSGNHEIYVRRWNGTVWAEMGSGSASGGGISNNDGSSGAPTLAISADSKPIIAWHNDSGGFGEIYVRRWNGAAWEEMGASSASGGGISNNSGESWYPSLAIGPDGVPVVAWQDDSGGNWEIYVRRWNGAAWAEMGSGSASGGGISNNSGESRHPALAIRADNTPIITWDDDSGGNREIYVRRWNGSIWQEMGAGSSSSNGISNSSAGSWYPSIAIGPGGAPVIAWQDYSSGDSEIYVRRWNGLAWQEMGASSASGGGISDNGWASSQSSLVAGPGGVLVISWHDESGGNYAIYVRRWNGSIWQEMGAGSASGGGISNNSGDSRYPSLAIGQDGAPTIAWHDDSSGISQIYVRQHPPTRLAYVPLAAFAPCFAGPTEIEPNNNAAQANGPLCSGRAYTGLPDDRYDVFSLNAAAGPITLDLTNHTGSGVQLQLHHQAITADPIAIDYTSADGYRIVLPNAPAGRYYIVISTTSPDPGATTLYTMTPTFTMSD